MPGPVPNKRRERRADPARGEWVELPSEPYTGDRPKAPTRLLKATRETWSRWWASPQAHMWQTTEWQVLRRAIRLVDKEERAQATGEDRRELRQLEDALGLSRKGLQDRRWLLPGELDKNEVPPHLAPVADIASRSRSDPRRKAILNDLGET